MYAYALLQYFPSIFWLPDHLLASTYANVTCDSNANPDGITYPIPGNDDALRAINLYCDLISDAVLDGIQAELKAAGVDVGTAEVVPEKETTAPAEEVKAE